MAGFGGFGGFGQNNNNTAQQGTGGFGGFGSNNTTNSGFGSGNTFGATNNTTAGGGLFGGGGSGGFGSSGGGFGSGGFGAAKPATGGFGTPAATTGGSMFGGGTSTTNSAGAGFGGFGQNTNTSTGFGAPAASTGGLFGASKPAFGAAATSSPFGGATNTGSAFSASGSAFGAPASTALGGAIGQCQGTGAVPFQAFVEKEPNNATQQNSFQSISFQQPYQNWSPEELRLADYTAGRKNGNGSNQPGAFGANTNFGGSFGGANTTGGFGSNNNTTGGGLFGNTNAATNSPFGASQPASSAFGSNTATAGGGLFGAKPAAATGGIFGSSTTSTPAATGGLFGSGGGFGSTPTPATGGFGVTNTGGSLFGNNNPAAKPFSFGNTTQSGAGGTGFGASAGGFGSGTTGGLFGNNTQQNTTTGFGQQPAATNTGFGGFGQTAAQPAAAGNSLFGNTQAKPAGGLFGAPAATPNTGGGLFGNNAQPAANTNPFGGSTTTQNTGSLFGAPKPAGGSLFGNTATQTNTGGGLFGGFGSQNQNNTQQQGNSLFGGLNNNNNQQKPSLFTQTQQPAGNSLFGNTGNQQQGGSLFGGLGNNQQSQQQPQNSLFGGNNSILGNSQQGQQNSQSLTASISDNAAYGGASLFSSLQSNQINNPGPIATPLSSSVKQKKTPALPMYKLNSASSRFSTPQKRGFGFSYSNYGTPGSASSTSSTPGTFSGSSFGSTLGRTLKPSMSMSSLRRSFGPEDSILAPGAFSASPSGKLYGSTGSVKRLNINRNLRTDLFTPPSNPQQAPATPSQSGILKKRVSFNDTQLSTNGVNTSSPLKNMTNGSNPSSEDLGFIRPAKTNGKQPTVTASPEMQQVQGNELAIVHEEGATTPSTLAQVAQVCQDDQEPGAYWMEPSLEEIKNMNLEQRKHVSNFVVGREGVGQVSFGLPIDFTIVNPDEVMDNIVRLTTRSCTVYSDESRKPAQGKGLNVPSTISLQNSWPRKKDHKTPLNETNGARVKKHVDRLKRVPDTTFVAYDKLTGVWTFKVDHFTTYGDFDDDDENETEGESISELGQSTLSAPPDTFSLKSRDLDQSFASNSQATNAESDLEDTFDFKNTKGKKVFVPGAFGNQETFVEDEEMEENEAAAPEQSFLDEGSVGSQSEDGVDEPMDQDDVFQDDESVSIVDQEMAGSYPQAGNTTELEEDGSQDDFDVMDEETVPQNALVRARLRAVEKAETPAKKKFTAGNDWTAALRNTVSPKKQDRAFLKSLINVEDDSQPDFKPAPVAKRVLSDGRGFATSIDLMNSLFGPARSPAKPKVSAQGKGFELPYTKRAKTFDNSMSSLTEMDRAFHESMKPSWGPDGTLVYSGLANAKPSGRSSQRRENNGLLVVQKGAVVSEGRDVHFAKFSNEGSANALGRQKNITIITNVDGVPFAKLPEDLELSSFYDDRPARDPAAIHEKRVWQLASILWDPLEVPESLHAIPDALNRLRRDKLSSFWKSLVDSASSQHVALAKSDEEKAIASLSGYKVADACGHLINGKNFHLATLIAAIGSKESVKRDIREQLEEWRKAHVLAEFSQPIRALYELLAGNVCICAGSKGDIGEDRVESFGISKRFGLDWRQAFGLRLWYGSLSNEPIESTVQAFAEDLANDKETAKPQAWYVEEKIQPLWEDEKREEREDLLWGLLKLHTFEDTALESVISPANSQLSPLDFRLSWQLSRALTNDLDVVQFKDESKGDELTLAFASQLTNEGSWLEAVFVLLHLSSAGARAESIQNYLAKFAGRIGSEDSQNFNILTHNLQVPASWIWEAKALYMRSVEKNPQKEVECLIRAGSFDEAHLTFAKEVAPKTVVELDYEVLRSLLGALVGQKNLISEWRLGGQIYLDFLELIEGQKKGFETNLEGLDRLLTGLPAVVDTSRKPSFMETVAVQTMSAAVAKQVVAMGKKGQKVDLPRVLRLPLTEDNYLRHTVNLSLEYYRNTMLASASMSTQ